MIETEAREVTDKIENFMKIFNHIVKLTTMVDQPYSINIGWLVTVSLSNVIASVYIAIVSVSATLSVNC